MPGATVVEVLLLSIAHVRQRPVVSVDVAYERVGGVSPAALSLSVCGLNQW